MVGIAFVGDLLNPLKHSAGPFFYFRSLHECQDEDDFLLWGVEACDIVIECQIFLHFVHEGVGFASFPFEERRVFAHGFDICCSCNWLCRCSSCSCRSSCWWSSWWSSWWPQRGSSGSSSPFSHCDIQEFLEFCFGEGVLRCHGSCCLGRSLGDGLGSSHAGADDAL